MSVEKGGGEGGEDGRDAGYGMSVAVEVED